MNNPERWPLPIHIAALGMEMCCIYSGLTMLMEHISWGLFFIIILCYPCVFLLGLLGPASITTKNRLLIALGLVFMLGPAALSFLHSNGNPGFVEAQIPGILFQTVLCMILWWLGINALPYKTSSLRFQIRFQIETILMLIFVGFGVGTVLPVILFFIFTLIALSLAKWNTSTSRGLRILQPMRPQVLIMGILLVLIPLMLLFLALSPHIAADIVRVLSVSWSMIAKWLDRAQPPPPAEQGPEIHLFRGCSIKSDELPLNRKQPFPEGGGTEGNQVLLWIIIGVLILAALFFLLRMVRSRLKPPAEPVKGMPFESISIRLSLRKRLAEWLGRILVILKGLFHRLKGIFGPRSDAEDYALSTPRDLYRTLLRWAARRGIPRSQSQTPSEYLCVLNHRFPQVSTELGTITDAYIRARYGRTAPGGEELEKIANAWRKVKEDHE